MRVRVAFFSAVLLALAGLAPAAEPRPLQVDDLFTLKDVGDPRVSPDGQWVAYTVTTLDPKKDRSDTDIYMVPIGGGQPIRLTSSDESERRPRFSPDGKWLAFLSGRKGTHTQVWLLNRAGGDAVQLTDYKASVSDLAWSPDGTRLALVVSDVDPDEPEEEEETAQHRESASSEETKKTAKPIVIDRVQFKPAGAPPAGQTPEATSLLGRPLFAPEMAPEAREGAEAALAEARAAFVKSPDSADAIIWMGRRLSTLGRVREAIEIYTRGIAKFSADPRFYRHRGHRYVSTREFDKAIADLTKAGGLIEGKPDEDEPSMADPSVASPETLHYGIWYHLGIAYYMKGEFGRAVTAFRRCLDTAKDSDDRKAGASDWLYMSLRRANRSDEASKVLDGITADMKLVGSRVYLDRLLMYKGVFTPEDLLRAGGDSVSAPTYAYAAGNWYLYNGQQERARAIFERILKGPNWMPFGFIGAEAEIARWK